jgi:large subunit ribosomal protein L17
MRHRVKKHLHFKKRDCAHRNAILRNLLTSFFTHGGLVTTEKRAVVLSGLVDRVINVANSQKEEFNKVRAIAQNVFTKEAGVRAMQIAAEYKDVKSGFTRITPIKYRDGDSAKLVKIELV